MTRQDRLEVLERRYYHDADNSTDKHFCDTRIRHGKTPTKADRLGITFEGYVKEFGHTVGL